MPRKTQADAVSAARLRLKGPRGEERDKRLVNGVLSGCFEKRFARGPVDKVV